MTPDPDVGNRACPPIITWRYRHPSDHAADFFRCVVGAYRGAVVWEFSDAQRMWVLMPARIHEYAKANALHGGLVAAHALMTTEPEFGACANANLQALTQHIRRHVEKRLHNGDVGVPVGQTTEQA